MYKIIQLFCVVLFFLATSCGKDNPEPDNNNPTDTLTHSIQFFADGGSFHNQLLTWDNFYETETYARYDSVTQVTRLRAIATWNNKPVRLEMRFAGNTPASFHYIDNEEYLTNYDTQFFLLVIDGVEMNVNDIAIQISDYGDIDDPIIGTFSGSVLEYNTNPNISTLVHLTQGEFSLKRNE